MKMSYKEKIKVLAAHNNKDVEYDNQKKMGFSHTCAAFVIGGVYFSLEEQLDSKLLAIAANENRIHINNSMEKMDFIEEIELSSFPLEIKLHLFQLAGLSEQFLVHYVVDNHKGDSCAYRLKNYIDYYFRENDVRKILFSSNSRSHANK